MLKAKLILKLNDLYERTLAKPETRKKFNDFLFFFLWKVAYFFFRLRPIDKKLVLFVANNDYKMPPEYRSTFEKAKENGYKCLCLYKFDGKSRVAFLRELSKMKSDLVFLKYAARAKTTFLYDYYLPAYANKPRKGTRLVQLWHGCGAFKKFGYCVRSSNWGMESDLLDRYHVHKTYTDIVVSSPDIVPQYAEALAADESIVRPVGIPRTDVYFDRDFIRKQKEVLLAQYPSLAGKRLILWAPTFRGNSLTDAYNDTAPDFQKLCGSFDENTVLLVKLHPHAKGLFTLDGADGDSPYRKIVDITKTVSIETALCCADTVITDYSSLIFEYSLFLKPIVFYAYDLEAYRGGRSFFYDYEAFVPGEIAKDTDQLIEKIATAEQSFDRERMIRFKEKFMSACDGNSTQRVFDLFISGSTQTKG